MVWLEMMGHGGGQAGGVEAMGEYCLCWQQHILGQGGGRESLMDKIGVGVGMIGQGGGHRFAVVLAGVCVL
jgi:hypothetical protein